MRTRALALVVALVAGCGASPSAAPVATPSKASAPTPASAARATPAPGASDSQAADEVAAALARVVALRQLPALSPVKSHVIARAALEVQMKREVLTDLEPALVRGITESLYAFGAVPADLDYEKTVLLILGTQLAGYYDPRQKAMFLLDDLGDEATSATLWHELVHALQDQHYDLRPKLKWSPGRGDATAAVQSLAEGDAMSAMLDVMLEPQGQTALDLPEGMLGKSMGMIEALPEIESVPAILKRSLVAAYADGMTFVHALRKRGGWSAVDAAWRDPPTTTEQILHPDKYAKREGAVAVAPPPPPAEGPQPVVFLDALGEQGLRFVLEEWMPLGSAASAAGGWGGDQVAVFADADRRAVALHLVLDDEEHAQRTFEGIVRGALAGDPEDRGGARGSVDPERAKQVGRSGKVCGERSRRGPFTAVRVGRDLGVALGPLRRDGSATRSDGNCAAGLRWATAIAKSRR